jgi:hypothetical protein
MAGTHVKIKMMEWNRQPIPHEVALRIGWNLPIDVVGAGVYGGMVKRDSRGNIVVGDEWPENNLAPPAHNPVHATGPFLDYNKFTAKNRGYSAIALVIMKGDVVALRTMLASASSDDNDSAEALSNLVMTGGARPLHMCGMSRGGDATELIKILVQYGAEVNAKDNYELTPWDRLQSNMVAGKLALEQHGGKPGHMLPAGVPDWVDEKLAYTGAARQEM